MESVSPRIVKCLDHGWVELIEWMPKSTDPNEVEAIIAKSARISASKNPSVKKDGTVYTNKDNQGLIRRLYRDRHTSPFESVKFMFAMELPIFVARHLLRHRMANVNEFSGRYSEFPENTPYFDPLSDPKKYVRMQAKGNTANKQMSVPLESIGLNVYATFTEINKKLQEIKTLYHDLIDMGIGNEVARYCLPLATYTKIYFTMDLHNLTGFLRLRCAEDAQYETRVYADAMLELIKPLVPTVVQCLEDYSLNSITFNAKELKALKNKDRSTLTEAEKKALDTKLATVNTA